MRRIVSHKTDIILKKGDITAEPVDAVVNAANEYLQHGGGVALAIVRKGGRAIQQESNRQKLPLKVSDAVFTTAGNLPAKYVIHTVGPRQGEGNEYKKIYDAVTNCLLLADKLNLKSIAFPAISSGVFGVPKDISAKAIISAAVDYTDAYQTTGIRQITLVLFSDRDYNVFLKCFPENL